MLAETLLAKEAAETQNDEVPLLRSTGHSKWPSPSRVIALRRRRRRPRERWKPRRPFARTASPRQKLSTRRPPKRRGGALRAARAPPPSQPPKAPGASIWRAVVRNEWCGHFSPSKRATLSFTKWGSSGEALRQRLRRTRTSEQWTVCPVDASNLLRKAPQDSGTTLGLPGQPVRRQCMNSVHEGASDAHHAPDGGRRIHKRGAKTPAYASGARPLLGCYTVGGIVGPSFAMIFAVFHLRLIAAAAGVGAPERAPA